MRVMVHTVSMRGVVVIGEGERDEAPMLFIGEAVGDGDGPRGRRRGRSARGDQPAAHGSPDAIAVIAMAERGRVLPRRRHLHGQDRRRAEAADAIDIARRRPRTSRASRRPRASDNDVTVVVLDRDRHDELIAESARRARASG